MNPIDAFLAAKTFLCPLMHVRMKPEHCVARQNREADSPTVRPTQTYFDTQCREKKCKVGRAIAKTFVKPEAPRDDTAS